MIKKYSKWDARIHQKDIDPFSSKLKERIVRISSNVVIDAAGPNISREKFSHFLLRKRTLGILSKGGLAL